MKTNRKILTAFAALCLSINLQGQQQANNWILENAFPSNTSLHYQASDYIQLLPGFNSRPLSGFSFQAEIDPFLIIPTYDPNITGGTNDNNNDGTVGTIPIQINVNELGASQVNIPLQLPSGISSMMPDLSLSYNSQAGDGILGLGWTIGGLSKISRIPFSYYYNSFNQAVDFTNTNQLFLDGMNIIKASDGKYYPEVQDFSVIEPIDSHDLSLGFKQYKANGLVYEYGTDNTSRYYLQTLLEPIEWHLSKITDAFGNYIIFSYKNDKDLGSFYPDYILYTGNVASNIEPMFQVKFNYYTSPRANTQKKYFTTTSTNTIFYSKITKLLDNISIKYIPDNDKVIEYSLGYTQGGYLPKIELINIETRYFTGKLLSSYNPIVLEWENSEHKTELLGPTNLSLLSLPNDVKQVSIFSANFSNKYVSDLVHISIDNTGQGRYIHVYPNMSQRYESGLHFSFGNAIKYNFGDGRTIKSIAPCDTDGDGIDEIICVYNFIGENNPHLSLIRVNPDESNPFHEDIIHNNIASWPLAADDKILISDFSGDGLTDLAYIKENGENDLLVDLFLSDFQQGPFSINVNANINIGSSKEILIGDFNGDKKSQILVVAAGLSKIYGLVADNSSVVAYSLNNEFYDISNNEGSFTTGDFNGDGKTDVLYLKTTETNNWKFYFSKGNGSFLSAQDYTNDPIGSSNNQRIAADLNNDGFTDIGYISKQTDQSGDEEIDFYYRTDYLIRGDDPVKIVKKYMLNEMGEQIPIDQINRYSETYWNQFHHCLGNFTGSSPTQLMSGRMIVTNINPYTLKLKTTLTGPLNTPFSQAISKVTDGLGFINRFHYTPFSYQAFLSYSSKEDLLNSKTRKEKVYQLKQYAGFMNVVSKLESETNQGNSISTRFYYSNPVYHNLGKGFLGFENTIRFDDFKAIATQNKYSFNNIYFHCLPVSSSHYSIFYETPYLIQQDYYQYGLKDFFELSQNIFFPYISEVESLSYEYPDVIPYVSKKTNYNEYDDFGNPKSIVQQFGNGSGEYPYAITKSITYDNFVSNSRRFIGLIKSEKTTQSLSDETPAIIQMLDYENDLITGFRKVRKFENGSSKELTEIYVPDNFGNIVSVTSSTPGFESRTNTTVYTPDGRFPINKINPEGHVSTFDYELKNGFLKSQKDENGNVTEFYYDYVGNPSKTVFPNGTITKYAKRWIKDSTPHPDTPLEGEAIYFTWTKTSGQSEIYTFFNQHQQVLREVRISMKGKKVYKDFLYYDNDVKSTGLLYKESIPYFGADEEQPLWIVYGYDYMRRLKKTTKPDESFEQNTYDGLLQTIEQFDGQKKTIKHSFAGLIDEITDNSSNTLKHHYYGDGKLKKITQAGSETTAVQYDYDVHRRTASMQDPALGLIIYDYNAFGDLTHQSDALSETNFQYDKLGRLIFRKDIEGEAFWQWDTQENGIGKLHVSNYLPVRSPIKNVTESFTYDELGQITKHSQLINDSLLTFVYLYDVFGRLKTQSWPSGFTTTNYYDEQSYLRSITNNKGQKLWEATEMDHWNKITRFNLGGNIFVANQFDPINGLITNASAYQLYADKTILQNMSYKWTVTGNLMSRRDSRRALNEAFEYDSFNRLTSTSLDNGVTNESVAYSNNGNISSKEDAGSYYYKIINRPYAVGTISPVTGPFPHEDQSIGYTSFNKVNTIIEGDHTLEIAYGPHYEHVWQQQSTLSTGALKNKRYFTPQYEIISNANGQRQYVHYLAAPSGVFGIFTTDDHQNEKMQYVINDHQGSIAELVDLKGNKNESFSFDAWGRRRNPKTWTFEEVPEYYSIDRGYTFHEHLDAFGLINMNGRMYDPLVGRMLSPDPFIQMPNYSQSYNRFTYAFNNPLRFTDLSGYIAGDSIRQNTNALIKALFPQKEKYTFKQPLSYFNTDNTSLGPLAPGSESAELQPVVNSKVDKDAEGNAKKNPQSRGVPFELARFWYQFGGGSRMDVELNSIDFSRVRMSDFDSRGLATIRLDSKHFSNINDALVHGTITLQRIGNTNQAKIALNRGDDYAQLKGEPAGMFNFEMQSLSEPINWIRNPETFLGGLIYGIMPIGGTFIYMGGKPFPIYYQGTITIKQ